ncbi:MAG TPA: cytochrome c3 family protein, partial [Nitrospiria bacterium]|nr:cytochrome c3 family protein [Nitrospiria bacterium]
EKVASYFQKKEPIPWVRVQALPDYVYFPHKRHLKAGLECTTCHGNVASMAKVTPPVSFKMGWCIDCHTLRRVENGKDCWTCHQ